MYEVPCLDINGNTINKFYQWDVDQKIMIELTGCGENYLRIAPEVHYTNVTRTESLVVRSEVANGDTITAPVPNILLQEPYPLLVYVYLTDYDDVSSQKTILYSEIPVRKRAKPSDYMYVENITRITANMIKNEIEQSTEDTRTNAINSMNSTKDDAIAEVTNVKNDAISTVTTTKDDAVSVITQNKNDFITTGNGLVKTATEIKDNTQKTYDKTLEVANTTQTTIETRINNMMMEDGLVLNTKNDGAGNVNLAILIDQS